MFRKTFAFYRYLIAIISLTNAHHRSRTQCHQQYLLYMERDIARTTQRKRTTHNMRVMKIIDDNKFAIITLRSHSIRVCHSNFLIFLIHPNPNNIPYTNWHAHWNFFFLPTLSNKETTNYNLSLNGTHLVGCVSRLYATDDDNDDALASLSICVCWLHAHHQIGNHSKLGEPKRIHWTNKLIDTFLYFAVLFTIASPSFIRSFIHSLVLFGWFGWLNFQVRDNLSYVSIHGESEKSIEQTNYQASQKRSRHRMW